MSEENYDATPNLGDVLDMMEGYSYDLWDAIFELVDNSYDSFIKNKKKMSSKGKDWEINIAFDNTKRTFRITDNAYGMNKKELENALLLAQKNEASGIIGKYGMGLKTAASWLGKHWVVKTKQYGSNTEYTAIIDILKLKKTKSNFISIKEKPVSDKESSYTIIEIKKGCRVYGSSTITKAKRELELAYQKLLSNKSLKINYRGESLSYSEPPILTEFEIVQKDGESSKIETKYDFTIDPFEINGSIVSGRYGLYVPQGTTNPNKSQVPHAGLTMFYNNRVILSRKRNKWPEKIFGSGPGDLARQRMFLKLDVELTPNALKTDFLWKEFTLEKLEQMIIEKTDKHIQYVRKIATNYRSGKGKLTAAQKKMSDAEVKKRMESNDVGGALAPAMVAVKTEPVPMSNEEVIELQKLDQKPLHISIMNGQPNVEVYMGLQHSLESFVKIKTEPKRVLCFINPQHPFYSNKIGADPELYQLYMDFCTNIALSKYTSDQVDTEVSPEAFLQVLDIFLRQTGNATES